MNRSQWMVILCFFLLGLGCVSESSRHFPGEQAYRENYRLDIPNTHFYYGVTDNGTWTWKIQVSQARGTIMLLHGYLDHSAMNRDLIHHLVENDFNLIAWDLPGHGLSSGDSGDLEDFQIYRDAFYQVFHYWNENPGDLIFIGHSTGAAIIMDHLLHYGQARGAVLGAPLLKYSQWDLTRPFLELFKNRNITVPASRAPSTTNGEFHQRKLQDPLRVGSVPNSWPWAIQRWYREVSVLEGGNQEIPMLVLQGKEDSVLIWEDNIAQISQWFPQATVYLYDGLMHHIFNEIHNEEVYQQMDLFLESLTFPSIE